jgi:hypothetical protein
VTINGGAEATRSAAVKLALTATDISGGIQMCVSNTASCSSWTTFAATKSWTLTAGSGAKTVNVWFRDKWGNTSAPISDTILLDTTPPANGTVTVTRGGKQLQLAWSGFTDAHSDIVGYRAVFQKGSAPSSCSYGTALPGYDGRATSFVHTGLTNGTVYGYRICAIDKMGNRSTGATVTGRPAPELNAPSGTVTINGGAVGTRSRAVILTLTTSDESAGTIQMCVSNTDTCTAWTTFAAKKGWTLPAGSGAKTVNVWFRDIWGNTSQAPVSDMIVLDMTPPTNGAIVVTPADKLLALSWSGFGDAHSEIRGYVAVFQKGSAPVSCSYGIAVPGYEGTDTSLVHAGLANGTLYGYRICAIDALGNRSTGATATAKPSGL